MVDDYLVLSVSENMSLLSRWGKGLSLARNAEFAPLRDRSRPSLSSMSYTSRKMIAEGQWTREDVRNLAQTAVSLVPDQSAPKGLKARLASDLDTLAGEMDFPEPESTLSFSFENRGIETYSFEAAAGSPLNFDNKLTVMAHRGKNPICTHAFSPKKDLGRYAWCSKWMATAFGYFTDYVVPDMGPDERAGYDKAMKIARPFLTSVDEAIREQIIPSIDGAQGLIVIDGGGKMAGLPLGWGVKMPIGIPIPRMGVACKLNDPEQFVSGVRQCSKALEVLTEQLKEAYQWQFMSDLEIKPVTVSKLAGGDLYSYGRIVYELGDDALPCALIKGDLLVLSSSRSLAGEMAQPVPMPTDEVTSPEKTAGDVTLVDFGASNTYLSALGKAVIAMLQENEKITSAEAEETNRYVSEIIKSLGALRRYSSASTVEGGRLVTHSWLHVEDISE